MRRRLPAEVVERAPKTAESLVQPAVVQVECRAHGFHVLPSLFVKHADDGEGTVCVMELDEAIDVRDRLSLLIDLCQAHEGRL